jgi:hypothetical protein
VLLDGINTVADSAGFWNMNDARIHAAQSYRAATLQADTGVQTTFVARTSSSLSAANNPFIVKNIVFDAEDLVTQAIEIGQDAAEDITTQFHGCEFNNGGSINFLISNRRGRVEIVDAKLSGSPSSSLLVSTTALAGDGNQAIDIQTIQLSGICQPSGSLTGVKLTKVNNLTNTFDVFLKGLSGSMTCDENSDVTGVDINGAVAPQVSNGSLTITSENNSGSSTGILVRGQTTAVCSDATIANMDVTFNCPAGFAIMLGQSTVDSNVTGGLITGCRATGKFFSGETPHNFLLGQATSGKMAGNESIDGFVGYLISKTTTADVQGNLTFDCYGPSYYCKGVTAATVKDNVAVSSGKFLQTENGFLAVADQGGVNNVAAVFQENLVIVKDINKIHSLASKTTSQGVSFIRNTYIIPDTVDLETKDLFAHDVAVEGVANNTFAEWLAQTEVTDDIIVQLPQSAINALVEQYRPESAQAGPSLTGPLTSSLTG